jgi:hypothetical protein
MHTYHHYPITIHISYTHYTPTSYTIWCVISYNFYADRFNYPSSRTVFHCDRIHIIHYHMLYTYAVHTSHTLCSHSIYTLPFHSISIMMTHLSTVASSPFVHGIRLPDYALLSLYASIIYRVLAAIPPVCRASIPCILHIYVIISWDRDAKII